MADPLSITASIISVLQAAAVATDYLRGIKDGASDRVRLRDELRNTTHLLEMLRDRVEDVEDTAAASGRPISIESLADPDSPVSLFQRTLEEIIAKLSPKNKLRQQALRLEWPFTKKDISEKLECLERIKSHISVVMQNDLLQLAQASHKEIIALGHKIDDTHLRHREDQTQRVILWLNTLSFREQHVSILESVQAGTGSWFIKHEKMQMWLEGKTSILWCPGIPGAGKTRLMSIVVDTLEKNPPLSGSLHTYIYCNYDRRKEQTPAALLSSMLLQVVQHSRSETVPPEVFLLYDSHKKYGTRPTSKELAALLGKLTSAYEALFVVIDALDEFAESEEEALQFLSAVQSVGSNVKIICSSRFSANFETYFSSSEKLEVYAQADDIEMFLDSEISRQPRLSRHVRADPGLRTEIIDFIKEECQGMFLLAKLHLESLYLKINRKAVRSALRTLPTTLDDTYSEALQRVYDQPADIIELAETVLFWVICAHQNLTVAHLQHMYATQELGGEGGLEDDDLPDGEILTSACGGLITVDSKSQAIHAVHHTVQQYFARSHKQKLTAARLSLTKVSLAYLALPNFSSGFCTSDTAMLQRLIRYPFLDYAAKYWGSDMHLLDVDELLPDLERLLSNPMAIEMASQARSVSSVRHLNWSQEFPRNSPALVLAAAFDLPAILRQMIVNGHELEGKGNDKETPLIRSAEFGHAENVKVLLELGAAVNAQDYMDETALHKAARNGHTSVIQALLDGGADVNNEAFSNWTPLMSAVSSGNLNAVRMLVEAGAVLKVETEWGDSALSMAVRSGQEAIAAFLADSGAVLPDGLAGRRASAVGSRKGLLQLVRRLSVNYKPVAGKPLQRQASHTVGRLLESVEETTEGETPEDQASDEISFADLMERYNIKTGFKRQYEIVKKIGHGSSATVYSCSHNVTGVLFAAKVFKRTPHMSASLRDFPFLEFHNEIKLLCEIQRNYHPNLARMRDAFLDSDPYELCCVTDLAPGGELFDYIVSNESVSEENTKTIFIQLLSAIQFLHDCGWIHRDIKPENIFIVDDNLSIQLGDFGFAIQPLVSGTPKGLATTLCGAPSYVAPEILQNHSMREYGFEVDAWSSGVVLYICLCGFPPFSDELHSRDFPYTIGDQIRGGMFDYPSPYWDSIGDPALDLIDRMLVVDPKKRFTAAQCLAHPWLCNGPVIPTADGIPPCADADNGRVTATKDVE